MSDHRHRFEQRFERSTPSCTAKVWECPCGTWNIRHFGCHNPGHDQDTLATSADLRAQLAAVTAALEETLPLADCFVDEAEEQAHNQRTDENAAILRQRVVQATTALADIKGGEKEKPTS